MDVFLAVIKPPAPVGKLNQFQVSVCSKYFLFRGEGREGGSFDSKPSIAKFGHPQALVKKGSNFI